MLPAKVPAATSTNLEEPMVNPWEAAMVEVPLPWVAAKTGMESVVPSNVKEEELAMAFCAVV